MTTEMLELIEAVQERVCSLFEKPYNNITLEFMGAIIEALKADYCAENVAPYRYGEPQNAHYDRERKAMTDKYNKIKICWGLVDELDRKNVLSERYYGA